MRDHWIGQSLSWLIQNSSLEIARHYDCIDCKIKWKGWHDNLVVVRNGCSWMNQQGSRGWLIL